MVEVVLQRRHKLLPAEEETAGLQAAEAGAWASLAAALEQGLAAAEEAELVAATTAAEAARAVAPVRVALAVAVAMVKAVVVAREAEPAEAALLMGA